MDGKLLGEEALKQIARGLRKINAISDGKTPSPRRLHSTASDGVSFFNDSGETIPANAVMRVTGVTGTDENGQYYTVAKPDATYTPLYLVNRALPIPYGMGEDSFGIADWLIDPSGRVLVDGAPNYGETWGPNNGAWALTEGNTGFTMQGGLGATEEGGTYSWGYQVFPTATQNYVEYTLDNRLVGFNAARGSSLVLDASNLTGWTGSVYRAGSESNVGIEYQASETAPNTNGLWKATQDGLFRITINGYWKLVGITEPSKQNQDVVTTGPASAGTAHTHSVTQTGHDNYILSVGPKLQIDLYNKKASGGAIAFHSDANGRFFQWQQWLPVTISSRFIPVVAQWNVCLAQNDKVALKWTAASMINHEWSRDGDPLKVRFEYIGEAQDWAAI